MRSKKRKTRSIGRKIAIGAAITVSSLALLFGGVLLYTYLSIDFSVDEQMLARSVGWSSTTFYADIDRTDGAYTPVAVETSGAIRKAYYKLDEISDRLKDGFISVEDRIFYTHRGVDLRRTLYAAVNLLTRSERRFGASTITQQVIKNISGDNEPTLTRKLSEIMRALNIEQHYSKDEIFEVYLNVIPMGESIYGVGSAARAYFGKEPSELTASEAATLIGITNAPSAYNPYKNPEPCTRKRDSVLAVMRDTGVIDEGEYVSAVSEPLSVLPRESREDRFDSWFTETVIGDIRRDFARKYGTSEQAAEILLLGGGYSVYTTMDRDIQAILERHLCSRDSLSPEMTDGRELSMVVTDVMSGDLLAIVGRAGEKTANRILNHATVPHTPASALKPLALYAPLIDDGSICWSTVLDDVPLSFTETEEGYRPYPRNSPDVYDGLTSVADALMHSKNTAALRLYRMRGGERIYNDLVRRYGISTLVRSREGVTDIAPAPLGLGQLSDGISLIKMTECYGAFPADGVLHKQRSYIKVVDNEGREILVNEPHSERIYSASTARIMNKMLERVTESGTARMLTLKKYVPTAGKTGTSSGCLDKMFIGYTPYYVSGIWWGGDRDHPVTSSAHISLWDAVMTEIHTQTVGSGDGRGFSTEGLMYRPYCMDSGELYSDICRLDPRGSRLAYGYFTAESAPRTLCSRHVECMYDSVTKGVVTGLCPDGDVVRVALLYIPDRSFPVEIYITDAEFVCRGVKFGAEYVYDDSLPYFYATLPEGEYAGVSNRRRQFNRACDAHRE